MQYIPLICGVVSHVCFLLYYLTNNSGKIGFPTMPSSRFDVDMFLMVWFVAMFFGLIFGLATRKKCKHFVVYHVGMVLCVLSIMEFTLIYVILLFFAAGLNL